jgi:hypothetical protein
MKKKALESLNDLPAIASYLTRIGAEPKSFNTAVVASEISDEDKASGASDRVAKEQARIRFYKNGSIYCSNDFFAPTDDEAGAIAEALETIEFPELVRLASIDSPPPGVDMRSDNIFTFYDYGSRIVMLRERIKLGDKSKQFRSWTKWSDGLWRELEPDVLPIWGMPQMKDNHIACLSEGENAARFLFRMLTMSDKRFKQILARHPWANELANMAHLGWAGGASAYERVDWDALSRLKLERLYIIADNDAPGREAIPHIAKHFHCPTIMVQFDDRFPYKFDLGEEFPENFFAMSGGERIYKGPTFLECIHPATWATEAEDVDGKVMYTIRESFARQWSWVEQSDLFVNEEFTTIQLKRDQFNSAIRPFSSVADTAGLLLKKFTGRKAVLTYRPDLPQRRIIENGEPAINLFRPTLLKPMEGDVGPWLEFLHYLFVVEEECYQCKRWIATLGGRLDIRMAFGILAISVFQGVGKTTLGDILAELVGMHNCSFPGESMIVQQNFNGWVANKRLVNSNEIYSGHSWQAYHRLKSYITDQYIEVNLKHQKTYTTPNWTHFYVCSNSLNALKIEDHDRRWLMPKVTEEPWPYKKFQEFREWLAAGGLQKILHWCQTWNDYVRAGEVAPMTESKRYIIEESRSDAQAMAKMLGEILMSHKEPIAILLAWVRTWCADRSGGKVFDTERSLGKYMQMAGAYVSEAPVIIDGRSVRIVTNKAELLNGHFSPDGIKSVFKHPEELMNSEF